MSDTAAQSWMHPFAWFFALVFDIPLMLCWPPHLVLRRFMPPAIRHQAATA